MAGYTANCVRSIVSMSPNGRVTLPAETRRALGLEGESFFEVHQAGQRDRAEAGGDGPARESSITNTEKASRLAKPGPDL